MVTKLNVRNAAQRRGKKGKGRIIIMMKMSIMIRVIMIMNYSFRHLVILLCGDEAMIDKA